MKEFVVTKESHIKKVEIQSRSGTCEVENGAWQSAERISVIEI